MLESSVEDNLHRLWMLFLSKRDESYLRDFLKIFKTTYKDLLDPNFDKFSENTVPNATSLPVLHEKLLPLLDVELQTCQESCMKSLDIDSLYHAEDIVKCLTIILRNGENIGAVGARAFVMKLVVMCTIVLSKLSSENVDYDEQLTSFVHTCLYFFECLYDPYFLWRKRLCGWVIDRSRTKHVPATLHIEVVPFLYESFKKVLADFELHKHLFHVFGAIIMGNSENAMTAICPAMIDVLLHTLTRDASTQVNNSAMHDNALNVKELAVSVFIAVVQVLVLTSAGKKEVEVGNVMEGFFQTLLRSGNERDDGKMQLLLLGAIDRMLTTDCREKLQPVFVCEGVFDTIIAFLQKLEVTGVESKHVQLVAIAAVNALQAILAGSQNAKDFFMEKIGYVRLAAALQQLGAPSRELLHALLSLVVEGPFEEGKINTIRNAHTAVMLIQWLPDILSHEFQTWMAQCLFLLAQVGKYNQIMLCDAGMLKAILDTCSQHHRLHSPTLVHLLNLLHLLGSLSITASELKQLIRLLRDDNDKPFPSQSRLMSGLAIMARRNGKEGALHYFDFCSPISGITMPPFRKWPGSAFTFHAWFCLYTSTDIREISNVARRMLYSFTTTSGGFEAFLTSASTLVVAVYNKKEYHYVSTKECRLHDDLWHCVDVVHIPSKHLLGHSSVNIFFDGKLLVQCEMKFPPLTEAITSCQISMPLAIGGNKDSSKVNAATRNPHERKIESSISVELAANQLSSDTKHVSSMSKFFSSAMRPFSANSSVLSAKVTSIAAGDQYTEFGDSISLMGSLGSCCVLNDVLTDAQVKNLYNVGPNNLTLGDNESLADLIPKLVIYYNAKASCDNSCIDLSGNDYHGSLVQSQICVTQDIKDVISSIGGVQVLWPLLERSTITNGASEPCVLCESQNVQAESARNGDSTTAYDNYKAHNSVTLFLILLHSMLHDSPANQDTLMREGAVATLAMLLQKVESNCIDATVLTTLQMICDSVQDNQTLTSQIHQYIIFDFRIWTRSDASVQTAHIQYISTLIKELRREYRKKYGVQFFMDVIRQHYKPEDASRLSPDECAALRKLLVSLVRYYVSKDITIDELKQILCFIFTVKQEQLVCEIMDMLISLLDSPMKRDQLFLLLYEAETGELLYNLFTVSECSLGVKERAIKIIGLLLKTDCVYEKNKARLRLLETGLFAGMTYFMRGLPLSVTLVRGMTEQVLFSITASSASALLSLLLLLQDADIEVKLDVSKKVMALLLTNSAVPKILTEQQGWQESVVGLLTLSRKLSRHHQNSISTFELNASTNLDSQSNGSKSDSELTQQNASSSSDNLYQPLNASNELSVSYDEVADSPLYTKREFDYSMDPNQNICSGVPPPLFGRQVSTMSSCSDVFNGSDLPSTVTDNNNITGSMVNSKSMPVNLTLNSVGMTRLARMSGDKNLQEALLNVPMTESYTEDGNQLEELCQNVLISLYALLVKGVEGNTSDSWKERGQVLTAIQYVGETHVLPYSVDCLVRRLLEMLMQGSLTDLKNKDRSASMEGILQLVRLLYHFLCSDDVPKVKKRMASGDLINTTRFSEKIIESMLSLFDMLAVWDSDSVSRELEQLGLSILLTFIAQDDVALCSLSAAKLNTILQTRPTEKMMQSCYILAEIDALLQKAFAGRNNEHIGCLMPIMKTLADQCKHLLNMEIYVPNLPTALNSATFFEDFRQYSLSEEWTSFIKKQVLPSKEQYMATIFDEVKIQIKTFVGECHEKMMLSNHFRNRERGESKLYFQAQITEPFNRCAAIESKRYMNVLSRQRNHLAVTLKQWKQMKAFLTSARGVWPDKNPEILHWKLAMQENLQRMRPKLIPNYNFSSHIDASRLRDNLGSEEELLSNVLSHVAPRKTKVEEVDDDMITDEDWAIVNAEINQNQSVDDTAKEKLVITEECEMVVMMEVIKGRLEITTSNIYFFDTSPNKEDGASPDDYRWSLSELREVLFRRYNLRRSALEFFMTDQTNYFLNFSKKARAKVFSKIMGLRPPNLIHYGSRSPAELLKSSDLTQKWVQREISNFEYLMQLNSLAGRTYNDLSQYPVFPWILQDYTSKILNLDDPGVYRDLSRPIGVVNKNNEDEVREKYENFEDPSGIVEKFHYGTHYSNAAGVMHYLVRLEPFTTFHIQLQSNRFDVADRQFHSIPATWQMLMESPNDVKELIPEFFFLPEFLENLNEFDLGTLQFSNERVNNVILPAWAASPEDFIYKHTMALESEYVSQHLCEWIDLIFGYKQKGPAAAEALNVFYYVTYEGKVDLDTITDAFEAKALEGMINNFGQTPSQLLKEPHPRRLTLQEMMARAIKADRPTSLLPFLDQLKTFYVVPYIDGDPLVFVSLPKNQNQPSSRSVLPGSTESLVTVCQSGILGVHGWLPYDKNISNYFTFEKDITLSSPRLRRKLAGPFAPGRAISAKLFVTTPDGKLVISGGHWDNSLRVFSMSKNRTIAHLIRHTDIVTCVSTDINGSRVISGSRDTTCVIWQVMYQSGVSQGLNSKPMLILYGHDEEVTCVALSLELDIAVSGSKDGTIIIHSAKKGTYLRTLRPPAEANMQLTISMLALSDLGQICLYCNGISMSRTVKEDSQSLHVFSVNGKHLFSENVHVPINHFVISGAHMFIGNQQGVLIVKEIYGLKTLVSLPLGVAVSSLTVTPGNTHILIGLRDGKLIIVGARRACGGQVK